LSSYYAGALSFSNLAIDTDGTVSLAITTRTSLLTLTCDNLAASSSIRTSAVSLFQLKPDSSTSVTPIRTASADLVQTHNAPWFDAWQAIPDGQGGTLVAWYDASTPNQPLNYVTHVSASGNTDFYFPSLYAAMPSMVLGENGTAYVTDTQTIQAFNVNSGALWNYVSLAYGVEIIASTAGGGLVAEEFSANNTTNVLRFDSSGAITPDSWSGSGTLDYFSASLWTSYACGAGMAEYMAPAVQEASAPGTRPGGDPQHNGTTDPGLPLVATQDCQKVNAEGTIYARYPIYSLRSLTDKASHRSKSTLFLSSYRKEWLTVALEDTSISTRASIRMEVHSPTTSLQMKSPPVLFLVASVTRNTSYMGFPNRDSSASSRFSGHCRTDRYSPKLDGISLSRLRALIPLSMDSSIHGSHHGTVRSRHVIALAVFISNDLSQKQPTLLLVSLSRR
jgi:hypothetical protein